MCNNTHNRVAVIIMNESEPNSTALEEFFHSKEIAEAVKPPLSTVISPPFINKTQVRRASV